MHRVTQFVTSRTGMAVLAIVLGLTNAVVLFGWGPLNPLNTAWIFGDNATYYFGWALYRHDTHLSYPLAWTDRIGYPVGTSIALLDAIPLLAILLRPLSPILPEPFQYLGLYSALCFVLQAYFGMSVCRRLFPSSPLFAVLGSGFVLLSAPMTWRALGHTALLSHWLILAGLDCYFREPDNRPVNWLARFWVVLALAAAVTPYVAAMCFLVALTGVARLVLERRCTVVRAGVLTVATIAVLFGSLSAIGVLVARDASVYWAPGYGLFSLNLNAPVNPMEYGSVLLPALPLFHPAQTEGYNYLGIGVITLLIIGAVREPRSVLWLRDRRLLPLIGLALVCTAVAASTRITFGAIELVDLTLPQAVMGTLHGLRASGRLFWPAYYLLVLAALSLTFWGWKPPYRMAMLAIALAAQLADLHGLRTKVRSGADQRFPSALDAPVWKDLGQRYDNLVLIPPYQCSPYGAPGGFYSFVTFGKLAADERMRSNSYYAARHTRPELHAHCVELMRAQLAGTLDPRSAYVVTDGVKTVWALSGMRSHRCQSANGFNLCTPVATEGEEIAMVAPEAPAYVLGAELNFTDAGDTARYRTFGWGDALPFGTWTEGPMAMVRVGLQPADLSRPLLLTVDGRAFVEQMHPRSSVDIVVNGQTVDQWTFRSTNPASRRQARIPAKALAGRRGIDLEFRFHNPESPLFLGTGPSSSFLGLNVRSMTITPD
jgi:hypothetical protein